MDPAEVAFSVDSQVIVGRQQVLADDPGEDGSQAPKEEGHGRVVLTVNLERRPSEKVRKLGDPAQVDRAGTEIYLQAFQKSRAYLGRNEAFHLRVAVRPIIVCLLHARKNIDRAKVRNGVGSKSSLVRLPMSAKSKTAGELPVRADDYEAAQSMRLSASPHAQVPTPGQCPHGSKWTLRVERTLTLFA